MSIAEIQNNLFSSWPKQSMASDMSGDARKLMQVQVAAKAMQARRVGPGGQEADPSVVVGPNTYNNINGLFASFAPMAYLMPFEILDFIELMAVYNPDYSQAVENLRTLANPGHVLVIDATKAVSKSVAQRIKDKNKQIQHKNGGIDGLIDKLLWQASVYGAMAGEWVPNEAMTDIVDFIDVNPKTVRFFWEDDPNEDPFQVGPHWAPYQRATVRQVQEAEAHNQKVRNGEYLKLNEVTFQYFSFSAAPGSPYGVPPFLSALNNIAIQRDMMSNMASVVKKIALLGLIDMKVQGVSPLPGESQSEYQSRATQFLQSYADLGEQMLDSGAVVHFDDSEVKSTNLSGNASGATNIFQQNEEQVFSGLKSMPSVQGRCVAPETLVLTAELDWVRADSLRLGEELIGFDEDLGKGHGRGSTTRYRSSFVECADVIQLPCFKITTDQGEITVSSEHPLVGRGVATDRKWIQADKLQVGDRLIWFGEPWETDNTYEGGYLSGMFDGEGSLGHGGTGKNGTLTMAQLDGPVMDETSAALKQKGFDFTTHWREQENGKIIGHLRILGGKYETMRFLGMMKPCRFMATHRLMWEGHSMRNGSTHASVRKDIYAQVLKIEDVGVKSVVALQTSSRTFFSNGLLSHNSYSTTETYAGVAYDIMIRQSLRYQRAAKLMIEYGYNLMTMLWGVKVKDIQVQFKENKSLQRLQIAQAEHTEIVNELMKWAAGITNQVDAAHRLGYPEPDKALEDVPNSPWFSAGANTPVAPISSKTEWEDAPTSPNPDEPKPKEDDPEPDDKGLGQEEGK